MSEEQPRWNIEEIANALAAEPLALFADAAPQFLRLGQDALLDLRSPFHARLLAAGGEVTVFDAHAQVSADGVSFVSSRADGFGFTVSPSHGISLTGGVSRPAEPLPAVSPAAPEPRAEKQPVATLAGTIGTAPEFQTTSRGKFKARFRLRVDEGEQTTWHTVLGFDKLAHTWQGKLVKGQAVTVRGYEHERRYTGKDGRPRREVELYAAAVVRQPQQASGEPDAQQR